MLKANVFVDEFTNSDPAIVALKSIAWKEQGYRTTMSKSEIGKRSNPTTFYTVTAYRKRG